MDTLFGHIHLVLAHGLAGGHDLAVQVGQADFVVVDEVQCTHAAACQRLHRVAAHAAACQRFHRVAAHAANAKHRHTGIVQLFHCFLAQQQLGAGILILHRYLLLHFTLCRSFYRFGTAASVLLYTFQRLPRAPLLGELAQSA